MNKVTSAGLNLITRGINTDSKANKATEKFIEGSNEILKNLGNEEKKGFINNVSDALESVSKAQSEAAEITKNYELGKEQDLTKVIVNQQISKLAFQITLNVRNKVLSAYKDIMNMPV
tara:strand:+ start:67 stop:420 length:354 start_codon:yes stop_codon:yes gene_type:complete